MKQLVLHVSKHQGEYEHLEAGGKDLLSLIWDGQGDLPTLSAKTFGI